MNIKNAVKMLFLPTSVAVYIGCSPVTFDKDNEAHKCQDSTVSCIAANGRDYFDETFKVGGGEVDILIVNDNSASMSFEQSHLAQRLSNFVAGLESHKADYRIAITTTDISTSTNPPRAVNLNGALQDGRLIKFDNGEYFLTAASGSLEQKDQWFKKAIQRPETLSCEAFIRSNYGKSGYEAAYNQNCPSGDERGIYAANLAIKNNSNSFLRPNAHLAVIFLADEDVRSQLYYNNTPGFELSDLDTTDSLIKNVKATYPGKVLSVHSIITATQQCLAVQNSQMVVGGTAVVKGSYGWAYAKASQQTAGVIGDICESDYAAMLGEIRGRIEKPQPKIYCDGPTDLVVTITGQPSLVHTVNGRNITFNEEIRQGTTIRVQHSCESL